MMIEVGQFRSDPPVYQKWQEKTPEVTGQCGEAPIEFTEPARPVTPGRYTAQPIFNQIQS